MEHFPCQPDPPHWDQQPPIPGKNVSIFGNLSLYLKLESVQYFETRFLTEVREFIANLDPAITKKLFYTIRLAERANDPKRFKKLQDDIWEFRIRHFNIQIRLLAFWDKTDSELTLVFATHGFIKKVDRVPGFEIDRAKYIRTKYFDSKK